MQYGETGTPNYTEAFAYFNDSASRFGDSDAQHYLALMYSIGLGVPQDAAMAVLYEYFSSLGGPEVTVSVDGDDADLTDTTGIPARMAMGYRHLMGYNVPKSCEAAVAYYQPVAEHVVHELETDGVGTIIEKARLTDEHARTGGSSLGGHGAADDDEDVIQYYQQSADNGDVGAQLALGQLSLYGARGVEQNPERAARYFRAAAAQGNTEAMSALGQMHVQGLGVEQENDTALEYFKRAAEKGNSNAQNGLGFMYLHGQGVKQDQKEALK